MSYEAKHFSVLLKECIENLKIKPEGIYLDGTLGLGGHSYEIASRLTTGRLIGIDRDETAIERAGKRLAPFGDKVSLVHGNFADAAAILDDLGIQGVDGMLFDLGVSSPQLDEVQRGFSYMADAPLDMRMDEGDSLSAYEVVNSWDEKRLNRILWDYGEERYARRISRAIVEHREKKPIETTLELVDIIKGAMPAAALREKQHPKLSGHTHCSERRAGGHSRHDGDCPGQAEQGREALRNKLPLPGRQNSQGRYSRPGKRLHLPQRGAHMHLRLCSDAEERLQKAHPAQP